MRKRCHCSVPGWQSAGQVTPVAPSMSAEMRIFTAACLPLFESAAIAPSLPDRAATPKPRRHASRATRKVKP